MVQLEQTFKKQVIKSIEINYLLYLPIDYEKENKLWPLILFLHGAGERGEDLKIIKRKGIPKIVEEVTVFPFITISPQCPKESWWGEFSEEIITLIDEVISTYRVDERKVYLTGLSMGGYGVWLLSALYPDRFTAIAPFVGVEVLSGLRP